MRQCELEKVVKERNNPQLKRSGEKLTSYLDGITPEMVGSILELKKVPGQWVLTSVNANDISYNQIKKNSYVGVLSEEIPEA